jgi:hypothetical protein
MAVVAWQANALLTALVSGETTTDRLVRVSGAIGSGLVVLLGAARALRIGEFADAVAAVRRRLLDI